MGLYIIERASGGDKKPVPEAKKMTIEETDRVLAKTTEEAIEYIKEFRWTIKNARNFRKKLLIANGETFDIIEFDHDSCFWTIECDLTEFFNKYGDIKVETTDYEQFDGVITIIDAYL